jgi:hypothetical protein
MTRGEQLIHVVMDGLFLAFLVSQIMTRRLSQEAYWRWVAGFAVVFITADLLWREYIAAGLWLIPLAYSIWCLTRKRRDRAKRWLGNKAKALRAKIASKMPRARPRLRVPVPVPG